ncbi:MAG: hypothetical protein GY830_05540 [Bacteroidetes bacterium]|nr:hypothetical protein [Bacteroidota bacterium]
MKSFSKNKFINFVLIIILNYCSNIKNNENSDNLKGEENLHKKITMPIDNEIENLKRNLIFRDEKKLDKAYKFHFPKGLKFEEKFIKTQDGNLINILFKDNRPKSNKVILFFNGNTMNLQDSIYAHNSLFGGIEMSYL